MSTILVLIEATRFSGPAKVVLETAQKLRDKHTFIFVAFFRGSDTTNEYVESIKKFGFGLEIIRESFRYDPRAILQLGKIIKRVRPDIVEAHNFKSSFFLNLLAGMAKKLGTKSIHYYHGEVQSDLKQSLYNLTYRGILRFASKIVVVSARQKKLLVGNGIKAESITVMMNGIEFFDGNVERSSEKLTLLSVGRLSFEKGHDLLLKAIADVNSRQLAVSFSLVIVGEGPQSDTLQKLSNSLGLNEIVTFAGYFSDTRELYQKADIFVLPSRSEGIPMVILEAALHGVPIVSFDIGGVKEVLPDEHSIFLVPPEEVTKLADAIQELLTNQALRTTLATEAMKIVKQDFSAEKRVKDLQALYAGI